MPLTEQSVIEGLERPEFLTKAEKKALRREQFQNADEETKAQLRHHTSLVTASDLERMHDEVRAAAAEVRTMYEAGIRQIGKNFGELVDKHIELAMGDDRQAITERRFLIKLFADLKPDLALETSANDLMMAAGRKAMSESSKMKLVRETVEITDDPLAREPDGSPETPVP